MLTGGTHAEEAVPSAFRSKAVASTRECLLSSKFSKNNTVKSTVLSTCKCNPPERGPREEKVRTPMDLFIRHLIHDVLAKKTVDKVLKLIRKLHWDDTSVVRLLHKTFTKPWKIKYSHLSLLAMLTYDLQRYYPAFTVGVVDQILEDVRRGLETNVYKTNQRRVATMKFLGELYIYRLFGSGIIFDTLWSLVTFGHRRCLSCLPFY
jgi:regulator of nonsense transcripts 2